MVHVALDLRPARFGHFAKTQARMQQDLIGVPMRRRQPLNGEYEGGQLLVVERVVAPHGRAEPAGLADAIERTAIEPIAAVVDRRAENHLQEGE